MPGLADVLTVGRLGAGLLMPFAILHGRTAPIALWLFAVSSDFADGRIARRRGVPSRYGAVLDPLADVTFILATFTTSAALGHVGWVVPLAIVASVTGYAIAIIRASRTAGDVRLARSWIGHAAGVVNYAAAGIVLGAVAWPAAEIAESAIRGAAIAVVTVNVGAVVERSLSTQLARRPT